MNEQQLQSMRHSLAHIMAQAVQHLWPQAKFGVGPAIDNGFYYDIDLGDRRMILAESRKKCEVLLHAICRLRVKMCQLMRR